MWVLFSLSHATIWISLKPPQKDNVLHCEYNGTFRKISLTGNWFVQSLYVWVFFKDTFSASHLAPWYQLKLTRLLTVSHQRHYPNTWIISRLHCCEKEFSFSASLFIWENADHNEFRDSIKGNLSENPKCNAVYYSVIWETVHSLYSRVYNVIRKLPSPLTNRTNSVSMLFTLLLNPTWVQKSPIDFMQHISV